MLDKLLVVGVVAAIVITVAPAPASAYTETSSYDSTPGSPWFVFDKNPSSPLNSQLVAYMSIGSLRYRVSQRAGSGDGSTNECLTNRGWLPDGYYWADARDSTRFAHYNKTWGSTVVRGWVWELGSKKCAGGSVTRTELFIHSQGTSGWSDSNYRSEGCIKINQTDRTHTHNRYQSAYGRSNAFLQIYV